MWKHGARKQKTPVCGVGVGCVGRWEGRGVWGGGGGGGGGGGMGGGGGGGGGVGVWWGI